VGRSALRQTGRVHLDRPELRALSYPEHGATRGPLPAGYRHVERETVLGHGRELFDQAAAATLAWRIQTGSGIRVRTAGRADAVPLRDGDTVVMRVPLWPLDVPCRVVYVVDEPRRAGFAYGTLPGHPESGEEAFVVEHRADDAVVLCIRAFSRPATWLFRIAYPAVLLMQTIYTRRYLRALRSH
jgi:uncharacterized protein (UPF0548 family)